MSCNTCTKLNPIPACIDSETFDLNGLLFPDHLNDVVIAMFTDTATGRKENIPLVINGSGQITGGFDVASIFPLMNHWYKLEFIINGSPANFTLTNPDLTTEECCCLEFTIYEGLVASNEWDLTSVTCSVE